MLSRTFAKHGLSDIGLYDEFIVLLDLDFWMCIYVVYILFLNFLWLNNDNTLCFTLMIFKVLN